MSGYYANITLQGAAQEDVVVYLKEQGHVAYVSPSIRGALVIFYEDLSIQEDLAARLSARFAGPALLVMGYGQRVLLYQLYQAGERTDAYVSRPHEELDTGDEPAPEGNAAVLCAAFGAERAERRVERLLRMEGRPGQAIEYAVNRHGELAQALGLPPFAAGASYQMIDLGELPAGPGFDPHSLVHTR